MPTGTQDRISQSKYNGLRLDKRSLRWNLSLYRQARCLIKVSILREDIFYILQGANYEQSVQ